MRWMFLAAGVVSTLCFNCNANDESTLAAESEATSRTPVFANTPGYWADTSADDFSSLAKQPRYQRARYEFAENDVLRARLQTWADRIHQEVQHDVQNSTGSALVAPKPTIRVVQDKAVNGWVTGLNACLTGPVDLAGIGTNGRPARETAVAILKRDGIEELSFNLDAGPPRCATATNWNDLDAGIAFVNATGGKCKLRRAGDRVEVFGEGCALRAASGATSARQLAYFATSPYVTFTTGMLARITDERVLVGILAHELSHYYRAHVVSDLLMTKYDYWYEQKDPPDPVTPAPASDSAALEADFVRLMPMPMIPVPGQKLSYRLTLILLDTVAEELVSASNARGADFACSGVVAQLMQDWRLDFGYLGATYAPKASQESYLKMEKDLLACASKVPVTEAGGNGALPLPKLRAGVARFASHLARADVVLSEGTLADVIATLQATAAPLDAAADAFRDKVRSRRLGRYTVEQEADEMSLEYFTRLGFDAKLRTDLELEMVRGFASADPAAFAAFDGVDFETCESWYRTGFRDGDRPIFVPLGNLHDPHHGYCYRLFNLTQEQRAHRYQATGTPPTFAAPWESVRLAAERATASTPGDPFHSPERGDDGPIVDDR